jgi:hypothetical protein
MEENEYEEYKENYFKNSNILCADFRCFVLSGSFVLDDQKFTDEHSGSVYDAASLDSF